MSKFEQAINRFDALNAEDPNQDQDDHGRALPKELLYAQRMSQCLDDYAPQAPEVLRLAVRCQHICRWRSARSDYPTTREGYFRWRAELGKMHADIAAEVLRETGYDEPTIKRVRQLVRKLNRAADADVQCLEDVICLVFLRYYFDAFAAKHEDTKVIDILRKTWGKMSARAHEYALKLPFSDTGKQLVSQALAE